MIKKVVGVKDKRLRAKSTTIKSLDKKTLSLIRDLKDTLLAQTNPEGVGLAAPQIGINKKVFAMKPKDKIQIVINPKIVSIKKLTKEPSTKAKNVMEGCLSLPHYYSPIRKPDKVTVSYRNEKWEKITETFTGFNAQIIQHEVDHLEGKLFIDHVFSQNKPLYKFEDGEWEEVELV